jgi:hypothetical protein
MFLSVSALAIATHERASDESKAMPVEMDDEGKKLDKGGVVVLDPMLNFGMHNQEVEEVWVSR